MGEWMLATLPGEPVTQLASYLRTLSPMPEDHTIVVGYSQDHTGYLLRPEDWLLGGYEPTVTFWGPLEAELIVEQSAALMPLATTSEREDGNADGIAHVRSPSYQDDFPTSDAPGSIPVGTIPDSLPSYIFTRLLRPITEVQPASTVPRFESVFFTWVGEDPLSGTPRVVLQQRDPDTGTWADVARRSGRLVQDGAIVLTWTPDPIENPMGGPRIHYYTVEMQAVTPMGMPGLDTLADRAGLPLGDYRFRVEGTSYELTSEPFTVQAAELDARHGSVRRRSLRDAHLSRAGGGLPVAGHDRSLERARAAAERRHPSRRGRDSDGFSRRTTAAPWSSPARRARRA